MRIEMRLRGRERALGNHGREKVNEFLEILKTKIPFKTERGLQRKTNNLTVIISKE